MYALNNGVVLISRWVLSAALLHPRSPSHTKLTQYDSCRGIKKKDYAATELEVLIYLVDVCVRMVIESFEQPSLAP